MSGDSGDSGRHSADALAGGYDDDLSLVSQGARIFLEHGGHGGYAIRQRQVADLGAGQAVAARVEGWTGDHEVGAVPGEGVDDRPDGGLVLFVEVVVPGDDCRGDLGVVLERLAKRVARSHRSFANFDRVIRRLFSPNSSEELVEEVDHFQLLLVRHDCSPFKENSISY